MIVLIKRAREDQEGVICDEQHWSRRGKCVNKILAVKWVCEIFSDV